MKATADTPRVVRTAVALGLLFLVDVWLMGEMSSGLLSLCVAVVGMAVLLVGALWAAVRGGAAMARSRTLRAGVYVLLGASALVALRVRAQAFNDFHRHLTSGMSVLEVLQRVDAMYARHPQRWTFIGIWGTTHEFALEDVHEATQAADNLAAFTWYGSKPRTSSELEADATALAKARQVWFTFRTQVGYLQFFVALDHAGRVQAVSKVTGHQA